MRTFLGSQKPVRDGTRSHSSYAIEYTRPTAQCRISVQPSWHENVHLRNSECPEWNILDNGRELGWLLS
jgi:hypothetical protein